MSRLGSVELQQESIQVLEIVITYCVSQRDFEFYIIHFSGNYFSSCIRFDRQIVITSNIAEIMQTHRERVFTPFLQHIFVKSTKRREAWLMIYSRSHTSIWERVEVKVRGNVRLASLECCVTSQIFAHTVIITSSVYKMLMIILYRNRLAYLRGKSKLL